MVGTVLADRYRILNMIGDGGMGRVYVAEHVTLRRKIAIKVLRDELSRVEANVERFLQEAQAASMVNHPNVVDILDFGRTPSGSVFFAMEYLEGEDLAALLRRERRLSWPQVQNIALQVSRGLHAAHEHGVIHRDMKPANIFLVRRPDGTAEVKLVDFGIAKVLGHDGRAGLTGQGSVFGTARYMSPEQASGLAVDARSDVYAVGILLYEMLTGTVPFDSDNFMRVASQHINDPIKPPHHVCPEADISQPVVALIMRALEKDPKKRYPSMAEFEAAILACAFDSTVAIANPLLEDGIDQTIIYDAERGQKLREARGGTSPRTPAVRVDPAVDATIVKPRPSRPESRPAPASPSRPGRSSPSRSKGPSWRPLTGAGPGPQSNAGTYGSAARASSPAAAPKPSEEPSFSQAPPMLDQIEEVPPLRDDTPPPVHRPGDGAFFAPSTASREDGMPSAAMLPRGMDRPAPIFGPSSGNASGNAIGGEPAGHRTLPPVNWTGGSSPNPATYENQLSRNEGAETAEFGLNVPRHSVSRNWLVVVVAAAALAVVIAGVAAWLLVFQEDNSVSDEVHPTVVADEPRPMVVPREPIKPIDPPPPPPEAAPEPEPVEAVAQPEPRPRKTKKKKRRSAPKTVDSLSDKDISRGFAKARGSIVSCGNKHGALAGASFRVTFDVSNGSASNVSVQRPQNVTPLGKCVKKAIESNARFAKSRNPKSGVTRSVKF